MSLPCGHVQLGARARSRRADELSEREAGCVYAREQTGAPLLVLLGGEQRA